jgi:predicted Zn-dependent protease
MDSPACVISICVIWVIIKKSNMRLKTVIQKKKILLNESSVLCNRQKMKIEEIIKMVEHYLYVVKKVKEIANTTIIQEKLNFGIRFNLFGISCTVGKLFELYNEIAMNTEGLKTYSKLWYNPEKAFMFSPSELNN